MKFQFPTVKSALLSLFILYKKEKSGHIKTRKRKSRDEIYVDPKEAEAASTAAKVLEEAFHQLCEMCGHYFQVGVKVVNPKYS